MRRIKLIEEALRSHPVERQPSQGLVNPYISEAAIGFRAHNDQLIGVALTPRYLDLLVLPEDGKGWKDSQVGEFHMESFPAGDIKFIHDWNSSIGAYGYCTLLTSVILFDSQEEAESLALETLKALYLEEAVDVPKFLEMSTEMIAQAVKASQIHESNARSTSTTKPPIDQPKKKERPDENIDENRRGFFTRFLG